MSGKFLGPKSEAYLNQKLRQPYPGESNPAFDFSSVGLSYTFEIAEDWKQDESGQAYFCKAKKIAFLTDGSKYYLDDSFLYSLYSPSDLNEKPTDYAVGTKVRAIDCGRWEIIGAGGGSPDIYGVVMETVKCPPDPTKDYDDEDFRNAMGKVRIFSKQYPTKDDEGNELDPKYDKCACIELAGRNDPYPEKLLKGTEVKLVVGGTYDNPDYVPPNPDGSGGNDEPRKLDWYYAIDTPGMYDGVLAADLTSVEAKTTISVKDSDGVDNTFTVTAAYLNLSQKLLKGWGVRVVRGTGPGTPTLVVWKSPCPQT